MTVTVKRIAGGKPIIAPRGDTWEVRGTSNSGAMFMKRSADVDRILRDIIGDEALNDPRLADGVVASLYTGVGTLPGEPTHRQRRGLALFSPEMELIKRLDHPVLCPSDNPEDIDFVGVEDARLTRIDGTFYAWYCGYDGKDGAACVAYSEDLLHWSKVAPLPGNINRTQNKDHVVFEERIMGRWWMLHRPWGPKFPDPYDMVIRLAVSDSPLGPWDDAGEIIRAFPHPGRKSMWVGGGAPPIALGDNRFLVIYHTGSYFADGYRQYDAAAALLDFNRYSAENPGAVVVKRLEPLMVPETEWEKNSELRIDIIFPMGNFRHGDDLVMVYGAGDKCTCAARMSFEAVVTALEQADTKNPYL